MIVAASSQVARTLKPEGPPLFDFSMPRRAKPLIFRLKYNGEPVFGEDGLPLENVDQLVLERLAEKFSREWGTSPRCFAVVPLEIK